MPVGALRGLSGPPLRPGAFRRHHPDRAENTRVMRRLMKAWVLAVIGTLVIHAGILAYLLFIAETAGGPETDPPEVEAATAGVVDDTGGEGASKVRDPKERFLADPVGTIRRELARLSDVSPEHLERRLIRQVKRFQKVVPEESVRGIQELIARAGGLDPESKKYIPDPAETGPFDSADFVIHDIEKGLDSQGVELYRIVMVDHKGATASTETRELSPELQPVHRIFNLVRDQPALRSLVKTAWQIADGMKDCP